MKKFNFMFFILISAIIIPILCFSFKNNESLNIAHAETNSNFRSLYLVDYDSDTVILEQESDKKYPIASMVKIMTLLLTFENIEKGNLNYDEKITISEYASSMGGSQLFLEAGDQYTVNDLIKGVTVCSANDAAVALGERVSGSITSFIALMNSYARQIGMNNTLFCNATGLPEHDKEQYSTAKDVSIMMKHLLSHEKYYDYTKIWMEDYVHPDGRITQIVNTNKLIRQSNICDAGKTGFTNEAMFCLSASAKKGDTRIICTVLGCPDSKTRFREVNSLLNYAVNDYETTVIVKKGEPIDCALEIKHAKNQPNEVFCDADLKVFRKKTDKNDFSLQYQIKDDLQAPLIGNTVIGTISLLDGNGKEISHGNLTINEDIQKKTFFDNFKEILQNRTFLFK